MRHIVMSHNENDPAPIKNCDKCDYMGTFTNLMYQNYGAAKRNPGDELSR